MTGLRRLAAPALWALTGAAAAAFTIPAAASQTPPDSPTGRWWVFFAPESLTESESLRRRNELAARLPERCLERRRKVIRDEPPVRLCDLPPDRARLDALEQVGCRVLRAVPYLNAAVVVGAPETLRMAGLLPFTLKIQPVGGWTQSARPKMKLELASPSAVRPLYPDNADEYGISWMQCALVNLPAAHRGGFTGHGVRVGVQDTGFNNLAHWCFRYLQVVVAYDFLNDDENVADEGDRGLGTHGTRTLSILAGLDSGRFIGAAPLAEYVLTKTEDSGSETPVEEDLWVAGLWFHDSAGTEVLSSSLSYRDWYEYPDMDGRTAVTSRAADSAAAAGMVIVNSMGNTGLRDWPFSKLGAPADANGVVAVGGVNRDSSYWASSSQGPTYDRRTKPDVVALASGVYWASSANRSDYGLSSGTSFSTPMVAGVAALMLQAAPWLTPAEIRELLRRSGDRHDRPDTLTGWGIPDALEAVRAAQASAVALRKPHRRQAAIFLISPNPAFGLATLSGLSEACRIDILDLQGRVASPAGYADGAGDVVFDLRHLPPGAYLLRAIGRRTSVALPVTISR